MYNVMDNMVSYQLSQVVLILLNDITLVIMKLDYNYEIGFYHDVIQTEK